MKKSISIFISVFILISCFAVNTFAADDEPPCSNPAGHSYKSYSSVIPPTCDCFGFVSNYEMCEYCGNKIYGRGIELGNLSHEPDGPVQINGNLMSYTCLLCKSFIIEPFQPRYTGDMNLDFKVTASDARTILRASVNLEKPDAFFAGMADVDNDSKITAADARAVLRMSVNLEFTKIYNDSLRYQDEIFTIFLPSFWRGKYDIVKNGNTTEFRLKNSGKLFDITFVPDDSYFIDGITQVLAEVSGNKTGYIITHKVTDLPCSPDEEALYMSMSESIEYIFADIYANEGYTLTGTSYVF